MSQMHICMKDCRGSSKIFLMKKVGDTVLKGEPLYQIIACDPDDLTTALSFVDADNGYDIGK